MAKWLETIKFGFGNYMKARACPKIKCLFLIPGNFNLFGLKYRKPEFKKSLLKQ